jgi:hypothetical protein
MFARKTKHCCLIRTAAALALFIPALLLASTARAGCDPGTYGRVHVRVPAAVMSQGAALMQHDKGSDSIVGLWHAVLTSPDGFGYQSFVSWHADGLEFETADIPPLVGAVCVGVWKQKGRNVHNNHFGWTWDASGVVPTGSFNLRETLRLSANGNSYTGDFDFQTFDINGVLSGEHKGTVTATRITLGDHGALGED